MQQTTRRNFARSLATGLGATALGSAAGSAKPNILFVCSDQHSHKYAGFAGHPIVKTPNLDRIAQRGVVFRNNYCGSPVCVPGRACMMTGMYPSDSNSFCNSTVWDGSHPTWGTLLRKAGYHTEATGKLDLNDDFEIGFKEVHTSHGHRHNPDVTSLFRRPLAYRIDERAQVDGKARDDRHHDAQVAKVALSFLREEAPKQTTPWAYYAGFVEPHPPFVALRRYYDMYPPAQMDLPHVPSEYLENQPIAFEELRHFRQIAAPISEERRRRARAAYYAMVSELDEYVGQLWQALEETGQLENTVFVYTSDHGEALGNHGLWLKNNLYDHCSHVPLIMAGAQMPASHVIEQPVGHVDLIATLLDIAGGDNSGLRGRSFLPVIQGKPGGPEFAYSESNSEGNITGSYMIRKGDWKYIHFTWFEDLLFNIKEDPGELQNRSRDPKAQMVLEDLRNILRKQVDTDAITRRAFAKQDRMLAQFATKMNEDQLTAMLEKRMGKGLARSLASRAKQQS